MSDPISAQASIAPLSCAALYGRDCQTLGAIDAVSEGHAAIALSRGGARKPYAHVDPNEDSALFAYGALFAGFGLQGLADTLSAGPIFPLLETVFPPAYAALGIMLVLEQQGLAAALVQLLPILMYMFVCALLGLLLTLGVPRRLAGAV